MATNSDTNAAAQIETGRVERVRKALVNAIGYMIPLVMSSPGLYAGIMTMPFLTYLGLMFTSQEGVPYLFLGGSMLENIVLTLGIAFFLYSVIFLWRTKSKGLVTQGPYRIVRHPQYLGLLMFTASLTNRSVWLLQHTFGFGYLTPEMTLAIWFPMMLAYIGLALFEEHHLGVLFQEAWLDYRRNIGFLIPRITFAQRWVEVVVTFALLSGLMLSLFLLSGRLYPFI